MLRRLLLTFALTLLFGLGQQGAVMHAVTHLADGQEQEQQQDKQHSGSACEQCVTYAKLASAIPASAFVLHLPPVSHSVAAPLQPVAAPLHRFAYSARAPPAFS